jgi:hypothetical protein
LRITLLQHGELLPKRKVFQKQIVAGPKGSDKQDGQESQRTEHVPLLAERCCTQYQSAVGFASMMDASDFDGIGVRANEEEAIVADAQPKLFSPLKRFHVARAGFRKAMQRRQASSVQTIRFTSALESCRSLPG